MLAGILLYALGVGIAHYLGFQIRWHLYGLGQAIVLLLQLSSNFLRAYYDLANEPPRRGKTAQNNDDLPVEVPRHMVLQFALTTLSVVAVLTALLFAQPGLNLPASIILGAAFILSFFYAVPPLRLVYSGYGELVQAILITNLFPTLAFLLQVGEFHRLLVMLSLPLTFLYLAMKLALSLKTYTDQMRRNQRTLILRVGWQRGMFIHNILILMAYLLLVLAAAAGLPWFLTWPGLLTLPLGIFQMWQMVRIAGGYPPRWRLLTLTATSLLGLTAYLLTLALWTS